MEREILFRGKPMFRESDEFVYGYYKQDNIAGVKTDFIIPLPEYKNEINEVAVCPLTVGQYTGLTDKNGVKIFEGDILDLSHYMIKDVGVVKFGEYKDLDMTDDYPCGHVGFYIEIEEQNYKRDYVRRDILFFVPKCKIIGNIHDNPEILKGED